MVVAKSPGAGQGKGGGRPRREGAVEEVRLRLSPGAAELLRAGAEARGVSTWRLVEDLVQEILGAGGEQKTAPEPWAPLVLEIAEEAAAFLKEAPTPRAGARALRRAWGQAVLLARHDLAGTKKSPLGLAE